MNGTLLGKLSEAKTDPSSGGVDTRVGRRTLVGGNALAVTGISLRITYRR